MFIDRQVAPTAERLARGFPVLWLTGNPARRPWLGAFDPNYRTSHSSSPMSGSSPHRILEDSSPDSPMGR